MKESRRRGRALYIRPMVLLALIGAIALTFISVQTTSAHAILLRSDPAQDAVLHSSPSRIRMWFTEELNPTFSTAYVVNTKTSAASAQNDVKTHVDQGDVQIPTSARKEMDVSLKPALPAGVYAVIYRTQSADDGHILHGAFLFTIAEANGVVPTFHGQLPGISTGGVSANGELDSSGLISLIMVTLVDLCVVFWMGAQLWQLLVLRTSKVPQEEGSIYRTVIQYFTTRYALPVLLILFIANIGVLVGQALSLTNDQWLPALAPGLLVRLVAEGKFGIFWILRELLTLPLFGIALYTLLRIRRKQTLEPWITPVQATLGLFLLAAVTLSGHAMATPGNLLIGALVSDFLHLLAASLWVGGMFYIVAIYLPVLKQYQLLERTRSLLTTLSRFSPLAFVGVLLMAISGPINASVRMDSLAQFFDTLYGRTLLVKIVCVCAMLVISTIHVFFLRPRLARDYKQYQLANRTDQHEQMENSTGGTATLTTSAPAHPTSAKSIKRQEERLTRVLTWEPVLGVIVLICTGLLTVYAGTLQPTIPTSSSAVYSSQPNANQAFTQTVTTTDRQYRIKIQISPNRIGPNTFTATVFDHSGAIVPNTKVGVSLYTTMLDMDMGTQSINLQPASHNQFSAPGDLSMGGHWQLRIDVRTLDDNLHHATFDFVTAD